MKNTLKIIVLLFIVASCTKPEVLVTLEDNKERWESQNANHYAFDYNISCFCAFNGVIPARVTVKDGTIISIEDVDTGEQLINSSTNVPAIDGDLDLFNTIADLFAIAEDAQQNAHQADITYDNELGYPTTISIDWDENIADDERSFMMDNLKIF